MNKSIIEMEYDIFKPEHFIYEGFCDTISEEVTKIANKKLKEIINSCTTMFIRNGNVDTASSIQSALDTHIAKLLIIKEMVKQECKHEPDIMNQKLGGWFCKHCGVKLIAEWKAK